MILAPTETNASAVLRQPDNSTPPSSECFACARRRYQKPTPQRRGNQFTILVREEVIENGQRTRKVKRIPIGPSTLTRAEAERARDDYLANINQAHVGIGGAILFRDFARIY